MQFIGSHHLIGSLPGADTPGSFSSHREAEFKRQLNTHTNKINSNNINTNINTNKINTSTNNSNREHDGWRSACRSSDEPHNAFKDRSWQHQEGRDPLVASLALISLAMLSLASGLLTIGA
ncbi:hypothetical protein GNT65_06670 [Shewanella sp. JBTF-M18]|uniref:Uncharacterized protein n=1 Tax=Shewanella insulae TaxID=2681496 RepID=A0A6L7HWG8_9GAMM|nr:hypothetical protein [Shewanella insulae]MXR68360.1 hypothetical protein [Shewanella insulae]